MSDVIFPSEEFMRSQNYKKNNIAKMGRSPESMEELRR
jgi:hypothetical protein